MSDPSSTTTERPLTVLADPSRPPEIVVSSHTPTITVDTATGSAIEERLVKSVERVRDLGEVFTPATTVQAMLDLLPEPMWAPHPSATFLEPACGDGNFLVAILERKLAAVTDAHTAGALPAGTTVYAAGFHALEALASVYAADISVDNIIGGTPGHGIGARSRLLAVFTNWHTAMVGKRLTSRSPLLRSAQWVVEHNLLVGNMLATDANGQSTGRDDLPLMEYEWNPGSGTVSVHGTTLGAVMSETASETTGLMSLFGPPGPIHLWTGAATSLHQAPKTTAALPAVAARNGKDRERR